VVVYIHVHVFAILFSFTFEQERKNIINICNGDCNTCNNVKITEEEEEILETMPPNHLLLSGPDTSN